MKIQIDENQCQGHALCVGWAPELISLRSEDGHAYVESEDVTVELEEAVRKAAAACPERAITVST
jgi:ferredoxin